jgi:hypothetical protein
MGEGRCLRSIGEDVSCGASFRWADRQVARNVSAFLMIHGSSFGEFLSAFQRGDATLLLAQPFESLLLSVLTETASLSHSSSILALLLRSP